MTVNKYLMPIIVIVALLGTVGVAAATGGLIFSGKQVYQSGDMTADDVKGWMTLQQVADGLSLPVETVMQLAGAPDDGSVTPDTALKDLEKVVPGFETSALRDAAAAYLVDSQPSSEGAAPTEALTVQPATATAQPAISTPAPAETAHIPQGDGQGAADGAPATPTPLPTGQMLPLDQIKGRMTLREVADQTGVSREKLLAALNLPKDTSLDVQLKDLVGAGKVAEVQAVRDAVAELQQAD
jgi:hypothetical protein